MCSIIWSETVIKANIYKINQIEKEDKMIKHYLTVFLISMGSSSMIKMLLDAVFGKREKNI